MGIFDRLRKKESQVITGPGGSIYFPLPQSSKLDVAKIAKEAYGLNVIVYTAISIRAKACAGIEWLAYIPSTKLDPKTGKTITEEVEVPEHPILKLLNTPNRYQSRSDFIIELVSNLDNFGNNFIEGVFPETPNRPPGELYNYTQRYIRVVPGQNKKVDYYQYERNGKVLKFSPDQMLHQYLYNPRDDFFGMSPLEAGALSIEQHNVGKKWNLNLLKNGANIGGIMASKTLLTQETIDNMKKEFHEQHQGSENVGAPMFLEGDFVWTPMGMTAHDMDWTEGMKACAREIGLIFHISPEILGDSSNKTYSNYGESRKAFYMESILPTMDKIEEDFNRWLVPKYNTPGLRLAYDRDSIEALSENRVDVWKSAIEAVKAGVLTPNEAREIMQYDAIEGGDELKTQPDGQFNLVDGKKPKDGDENAMREGEEEGENKEVIYLVKKNKLVPLS